MQSVNKKNTFLIEKFLFEDEQGFEFEQDPNHPLNRPTLKQNPKGANPPKNIGNEPVKKPFLQRFFGVDKNKQQPEDPKTKQHDANNGQLSNQQWDDRQTISRANGTDGSTLERFQGTLEVNMNNISRIAERTATTQLPRQHFMAHKEILAAMDNVYAAFWNVTTVPKEKESCRAIREGIKATLTPLNTATKGVTWNQR